MIVPKIVITGGSCGGKTTAMPYIAEKLSNVGFFPIIAREAPTHLINARIDPRLDVLPEGFFQREVFRAILDFEACAERAAQAVRHPNPVILCDRGFMDVKAYMPSDAFWNLVKEYGFEPDEVCSSRYLGVFHMRTAALGAEEFYTLENNTARLETPEEARAVDERTLKAWTGHSHVRIVGNENRTFEQKLHALYAEICRVLAIPVPIEHERRFLIRPIDTEMLPDPKQTVHIEQWYLISPQEDEELRLRKRRQFEVPVYYETFKRSCAEKGKRAETERIITPQEYAMGMRYRDPAFTSIEKWRTCFVHANQYFEFDVFNNPSWCRAQPILEIELTEENGTDVVFPPNIEVIREVTGEKEWSNRELARKR